ncbi:MAG: hypothetical protein ACFE9I_11955 [Candidatus Hermodarchaeota archaeon]
MSEKKRFELKSKNLNKEEEKILYGDNKIVCFACGEHIDSDTEICPYCRTPVK